MDYKIENSKLVEESIKKETFSEEIINRYIADAQHNITHHEEDLALWQNRKVELDKLKAIEK